MKAVAVIVASWAVLTTATCIGVLAAIGVEKRHPRTGSFPRCIP